MTAQQALEASYLTFDRVMEMIQLAARDNDTCLAYVFISKETAQRLRELGYKVAEGLGGGLGIQKGVSTITWGEQ